MQNRYLQQELQHIDKLFQETRVASGNNLEMQAHWAKYLCIISAGFLENAISGVYEEFVKNAASEPVANYTITILSKIQNPKAHKFIETASAFKREWGQELESFVTQEARKEAIDSIMANRHLIAHGKNSGVTVARLRQWLDKSVEIVEFIEEQCGR